MIVNRVSARRRATAAILLAMSAGMTGDAWGQTAYFSFQGDLNTVGSQMDFAFTTSSALSSPTLFEFRTHSSDGGPDRAGDVIPLGGIDSHLKLFNVSNTQIAQNDDRLTSVNDSHLTWSPTTPTNATSTPIPSPLAAGTYRLNLSEFGNNAVGFWTVDMVGPANVMMLNRITPTGTATTDSLKFGTQGAGATPATFAHSTGTFNVTDALVVAQTGNATLNLTGGSITNAGVTTVKIGGAFNLSASGTFNANGDVNVAGGTFSRSGGSFNLASGKTLTASSNAQITFNAYEILAGRTFTVTGGADFVGTSFLDVDGALNVTGSGSTLSTATQSFWGSFGGPASVTLDSSATATLGGGILLGQSFAADFNVQGGATATLNGPLNISNSNVVGGNGTLSLSGAGSTVTVSGSNSIAVGSAVNGLGVISVEAGTFNTGTGVTTINATGAIGITGGSFFLNGDLDVAGGYFLQTGGTLHVVAGKTIDLTNNGLMEFEVAHVIDAGTSVNVSGGGVLTGIDVPIHIADAGNSGTLTVSDPFSRYVSDADTVWGRFGAVANVTLSNSGEAQVNGRLDIASLTQAGTGADITIQSSAVLKVSGSMTLASDGAGGGTGAVTVNGGLLIQTGPTDFTIGHATTGTATLTLQGGEISTGTGTLTVNKTGTVHSNGGSFYANGNVVINGGTFKVTNLLGFSLASNKTLTIQNGGLLEWNQNLNFTLSTPGSDPTVTGTGSILRQTDDSLSNDSILTFSGVNASVTLGGKIEAEYLGLNAGSLTVDGTTSTLDVSHAQHPHEFGTTHTIGSTGPAMLTLRNNAVGSLSGTSSTTTVVGGGLSGGTGTIDVESGADLTVQSMIVAPTFAGAASGTVTVTGTGSTLFQNGASTLSVGAGSGQTGTINVNTSSAFTSGTGTISVFPTGTINLGGGIFFANGDVSLLGGKIMQTTGTFELASGKTLTANSNALMSFATTHVVGGTYNITGGADLTSTTAAIHVGDAAVGTLSVSGGASTSYTSTGNTVWGRFGGTANVTFSNAAFGTIASGGLDIASGTQTGTVGTALIQSAADVTVAGPVRIAADGPTGGGSGSLTVTGSDSTFIQSGANGFTIGHASTGTATLNVNTTSTVTTGTGTSAINKTGTVNIGGGTFTVNGDLTLNNGKLLHTAGTFDLAADKDLTASNSSQVSLTGNYAMPAGSDFTIQSGSSLASTSGIFVGGFGNNSLVVTGSGSLFSMNSDDPALGPIWGQGGFTADVTVSSQATAFFGVLGLARVPNGPTSAATFNILSGAQVTGRGLLVGSGSVGIGTLNISGTNSKLTLSGGVGVFQRFEVGGTDTSTGTVNVGTGGTLFVPTAQTSIVSSRGTIHVDTGGTFTATAVQNDGALSSAGTMSTNAITGSGATTVTAGTLAAEGGITQSSLSISNNATATIAGGSATSRLGTLSITTGGKLDLTDNALVVTDSDLATIGALIVQGYGTGVWDGNGITSTTAANDPNFVTAIGFASNADAFYSSFQGITGLDGNDVLVRVTSLGDSDLNGDTNLDDFPLFTAGLEDDAVGGANVLPSTWFYGDYDYNGVVNLDDFPLFTYGLENDPIQLAALANLIEMSSLSAADKDAMLNVIAAVPEPGACTVLLLASGHLLTRRRALGTHRARVCKKTLF